MPTARDDRAGVVLTFASPERCAGAIVSYCCAPGYSSAMECDSDVIRHPIFGADRHVGQRGLSECLRAPSRKCALLSLLELRCFLCRLLQYVSSHCRAILIGDRAVFSETVSLSDPFARSTGNGRGIDCRLAETVSPLHQSRAVIVNIKIRVSATRRFESNGSTPDSLPCYPLIDRIGPLIDENAPLLVRVENRLVYR